MQPLLLLTVFLLHPGAEAGRIIGGREARPHSRPYMAHLSMRIPSYCGGSLVREDMVLTAAHCQGWFFNITLGAHNIRQHEETHQHIRVKKAIPHPRYDRKRSWLNDIMLLQLERKASLTDAVKIIKLPKRGEEVKPGMVCTVAGWGSQGVEAGTGADKLQEVDLEIQRDGECSSRFLRYNHTIQICVGNPKENKTSYRGDSGGPFFCNNTVHGIVSYGLNNGKPPRVYTRISSYLSWIKTTMGRFKLQG